MKTVIWQHVVERDCCDVLPLVLVWQADDDTKYTLPTLMHSLRSDALEESMPACLSRLLIFAKFAQAIAGMT